MYSRVLARARNSSSSSNGARFLYPLPLLVVGASMSDGRLYRRQINTPFSRSFANLEGKDADEGKKKEEGAVFDITKKWNEAQHDARDFWSSSIFTQTKEEMKKKQDGGSSRSSDIKDLSLAKAKDILGISDRGSSANKGTSKTETSSVGSFQDTASAFVGIISGGGSEESIQKIVQQARESAEEGDVADKKSLEEVMGVLKQIGEDLKQTADKFLGDVDLTQLYPANLFYYMEQEDSRKTPSWKRRMHRFYPGIDIGRMDELNDYLQLAELSYADTVKQIQEGLEKNKTPFELVYVDLDSKPNRPAHFVAVKRSQAAWSPYLEVIMCVRGTKTITDAITDLLCDHAQYKGGMAHSGILEGGKYLASKHRELFKSLLKSSGKRTIKLTVVGHSLGAGAASIIGMELNDDPDFDIKVIGFGCPALLSKELSEQTKNYITTVVADDDCVPRLSAASIANALLDIMEYDYIPSARRDVKHAFSELQRMYPMIVTESLSNKVIEFIDPKIDQYLGAAIKKPTTKRMDAVLFPPGNIIHFYRDGVGVTGSVVPCDFFSELDITRRMVDDHLFFTGYQQIFLELMRQEHQDHNFRFD